jgi:hypothetical protein
MGLLQTLFFVAVISVLVYVIYTFLLKPDKLLSKCRSGTKLLTIPAKRLHGNKNSNNYAYSIWFYVSDWNHNFGQEKVLLSRGDGGTANPRITLGKYENNIEITIDTYQQPASSAVKKSHLSNCSINNFPLQRWVNLTVSLNNRTLDTYLNGKLVRTCILPAPAKIDANAPVMLTPAGGFKGWTSNLQYFSTPLNPQEAYNIYASGPKCGGTGFFDKYKLKLSYLVNNQEEASIEV